MVQAHAYWRMKGLATELVILNEDASVYQQALYDQIVGLIAAGVEAPMLDRPAGIFVRRLEQIPSADRILLYSVARAVFSDEDGALEDSFQTSRSRSDATPQNHAQAGQRASLPGPPRDLILSNGLGGFTGTVGNTSSR
jgi:cellobiose phosphorylase